MHLYEESSLNENCIIYLSAQYDILKIKYNNKFAKIDSTSTNIDHLSLNKSFIH